MEYKWSGAVDACALAHFGLNFSTFVFCNNRTTMRTGGVTIGALLLVLATTVLQVSAAGDIYWEGEEDNLNEFLEVKEEDAGVIGHLKRFKRQFTFPSFSSLFGSNDADDTATESYDSYGKDDDTDNFGSGSVDKGDLEPREKTLRVTFTAIEPYSNSYSDRDSPEFRDFSRSLANAVDKLYENLPGTQRSSLVRIQSHITDEFSCKVTLDIVTSGYEDIEQIKELLRDHIRMYRRLGKTIVNESDFNAQLINPDATFCEENEFKCDEYRCLSISVRCNGQPECGDGTDEQDCPLISDPELNENNASSEGYKDYSEPSTSTDTNDIYNEPNPVDSNGTSEKSDDSGNTNGYDRRPQESEYYDPNPSGNDEQNPTESNFNQNYDESGNGPTVPSKNDEKPANPDQSFNPFNFDQTSRIPELFDSGVLNGNDPDIYSQKPDDGDIFSQKPDEGDIFSQKPDDQDIFSPPNFNLNNEIDNEPQRGDGGRIDEAGETTRAPVEESPFTIRSQYPSNSSQVVVTTSRNEGEADYSNVCPPGYNRCDQTRCVEEKKQCDGEKDCYDGTDEANCPDGKSSHSPFNFECTTDN
ncbi:unnamed protein product [Arctia plantaginis]|uniref:SEA domain-containing protein n=1 Tax=Arctia plantaginis TaxID=874455 RepID=A0A8S1BJY7_ARCPL|nr:unnamed protein product [Arctia plantaginis]